MARVCVRRHHVWENGTTLLRRDSRRSGVGFVSLSKTRTFACKSTERCGWRSNWRCGLGPMIQVAVSLGLALPTRVPRLRGTRARGTRAPLAFSLAFVRPLVLLGRLRRDHTRDPALRQQSPVRVLEALRSERIPGASDSRQKFLVRCTDCS